MKFYIENLFRLRLIDTDNLRFIPETLRPRLEESIKKHPFHKKMLEDYSSVTSIFLPWHFTNFGAIFMEIVK